MNATPLTFHEPGSLAPTARPEGCDPPNSRPAQHTGLCQRPVRRRRRLRPGPGIELDMVEVEKAPQLYSQQPAGSRDDAAAMQ